MSQSNSPKAIYQQSVDAITSAILAKDLEGFHRLMALPLFISLSTSQVIIASVEELDVLMCDLHAQLRRQRVTQYRRTCLKAAYQPGDPNMIVGVHRSEIMSRGKYVVEPFLCHIAFMKIDGTWKAAWQQVLADPTEIVLINPELVKASAKAQTIMEERSKVRTAGGQSLAPRR